MIHIVTWVWGTKYGREYVTRLHAGLKRHIKDKFRWLVARPQMEDEYLTKIPGCFARLRMFDPEWQALNQIKGGDRVVCIDLDVVITGPLDPLFNRTENFVILQGANSANPCPMNGSLWMFRAGAHPEVWSDFSLEKAQAVPFHAFPDDQGWFWHKLPNAAGWNCGPQSGVYAFQKPKWPEGDELPSDARMVVFPGWRDPSKFVHLPWIKERWVE